MSPAQRVALFQRLQARAMQANGRGQPSQCHGWLQLQALWRDLSLGRVFDHEVPPELPRLTCGPLDRT